MQLQTKNILRRVVFIYLLNLVWAVQSGVMATSIEANQPSKIVSVIRQDSTAQDPKPGRIIKVPSNFPTIAQAIDNASDGDWIIISPGKYYEKDISINKSVTISSEWKTTGNEEVIDQTIIDSGDKTLFTITADSVEISGLHIINGDHTLNILSDVRIRNNHFVNNLDAMSFEGPGGGYVGYNTIENDRDDGLDLDIGADTDNIGSDILVEHNTIINSNDDGIEIRLFSEPNQNIHYIIRDNIIMGSKNAGIQLISYDVFTGKEFQIHHNIISGCKTGLGCMEGSKTREDLSGASKMDELVFFFNNTLTGNQMGATGGNQIIAVNNVVERNALGGFKNFGKKSAIINNLFYRNGEDDFVQLHESAKKEGNIFSLDPLLDKITFVPAANSPCVDAGKVQHALNGTLLPMSDKFAASLTQHIGAMEYNADKKIHSGKQTLVVEAGEDLVLQSPANEVALLGQITGTSGASQNVHWKLDHGPANARILNPKGLQTTVILSQEGIYQFSLASSAGNLNASDIKTIRYTRGGHGTTVFLNEETNIIEAEEYAYLYGNISVVNAQSPEGGFFEAGMAKAGEKNFVEYFIGTSESADMIVWLRVKKPRRKKSTIQVSFNHKEGHSLPVSNMRGWNWIRVPGKISMTAGEWPLLIVNKEGSVQMDKFVITHDKEFVPK